MNCYYVFWLEHLISLVRAFRLCRWWD